MVTNMYRSVFTLNPFVGCLFDCIYCRPSFQQQLKRVAGKTKCQNCRTYAPHEHPERLKKPATALPIVWFVSCGDISFCEPAYTRRIIDLARRVPDKTVYFQSKNPKYFQQFLDEFPSNVTLLTTLETNRDEGYDRISKAPTPSVRFKDFQELKYPRKVVTVEPVMAFDPDVFVEYLTSLKPEYVWLGLNSRPKQVKLPEPSYQKLRAFKTSLEANGVKVVLKGNRILV